MAIHIADQESFDQKREAIKEAGAEGLHVVSDFDRTLTHALIDGKKINTTYAHLREGTYLSPDYHAKDRALFAKYYPKENDPNLSMEEKFQAMEAWWRGHWELFVASGMNRDIVWDLSKKKLLGFRKGSSTFFKMLEKNNIPLLLFSAGMGDVIKESLNVEGLLSKNVHIVANFFIWDENGKATGYNSHLIHSFNKKEIEIKNEAYHDEIEQRKNVVLLGDSLADVDMTEGIEHDNIIRIGFLNDKEELLSQYLSAYDVVITGDGSLEYVNEVLKKLL